MKGSSIIVVLFLLCFLAVIFPTFYADSVNNTLTGSESQIIANMPIVFIAMISAVFGIYIIKERD